MKLDKELSTLLAAALRDELRRTSLSARAIDEAGLHLLRGMRRGFAKPAICAVLLAAVLAMDDAPEDIP